MWEEPNIGPAGHVDYARRTAACLGALGYSPHEVVCIVAEQLAMDRDRVANMLTCGTAGSVVAAA